MLRGKLLVALIKEYPGNDHARDPEQTVSSIDPLLLFA